MYFDYLDLFWIWCFEFRIFHMRKKVFGRQFKRDTNERKALFKNLLSSLILHGRIQTTEAKAKAIKARADKLITRVKKGGTNISSFLQKHVNSDAAQRLIVDFAKRFNNRTSGYTRILKIENRLSDNASMVLMEWTETKIKDQSRLNRDQKSNIKNDKEDKSLEARVQSQQKDIVEAEAEVEKETKAEKGLKPKARKTAVKKQLKNKTSLK